MTDPIQLDDLNRYRTTNDPSFAYRFNKQWTQESIDDRREHARIAERQRFLQDFYAALFQSNAKDFTKRYKYRCSEAILDRMALVHRQNHGGQKGYTWAVFGDNRMHKKDGINVQLMDPERLKTAYADFVRTYEPIYVDKDYAYSLSDNKWYTVSLDRQEVYVRVNDSGKGMSITGLVNPTMNITVSEPRKQYEIPDM